MLESQYQALLIKRLRKLFPGAIVLKNDPNYLQGFPDLTIFYGRFWAALEVKASEDEPFQPNQLWYVDVLDSMSFAAIIHPGNEEEVLNDLQQAFSLGGAPR